MVYPGICFVGEGGLRRSNINFKHVFNVSGLPRNFFRGGGGVKKIKLKTEGRENGNLGGGSPLVRGSTQYPYSD
jgi:hypothetical protein